MKPTTIAITDDNGVRHKITKIQPYREDGFAAFAPYHSSRRGYMIKHSIDYSKTLGLIPLDDCVEYSASDQVKLSVHLSGFVQFSSLNKGTIQSGTDPATGKPKGIGIRGDNRLEIDSGPLFSMTVWGVEDFETVSPQTQGVMEFKEGDFYYRNLSESGTPGYLIELFMFPRNMITKARGIGNNRKMKVQLPYNSLIYFRHELKVIDLPDQYAFLGVIVSKSSIGFPSTSGFVLNGPSFADPGTGIPYTVAAMYPLPNFVEDRETTSLDYLQ